MAKNSFTMVMETRKFNNFIRKFIRRSNLSTNLVIKKLAFDLLAQILEAPPKGRHPVDTGQARAGWHASIQGLGLNYDLTKDIKSSKNKVAEGKKQGSYREKLGVGVSKYVELINGVGHIIYLEYGYSKQAPYGMVRISMRKMRGKMPKELNKEFRKEWHKRI